jgi:hypothetical protein
LSSTKKRSAARDVTRPRAFFDRLSASREIAHRCQGAVEFSFDGYDDDERQLYEISEVRRYVRRLIAVLPELFFFARTEQPAHTLRLFALCLTTYELSNGRSTPTVTHQVVFETKPVGKFMLKMFPGLNAITECLGMSEAENKEISERVVKTLFGNSRPVV